MLKKKNGQPPGHDFFKFMSSVKTALASEYGRISARAPEDPGTAGDQGEENWAEFLRGWLPATHPIVTKGRILFPDGTSSPQVDILILRPSYPRELRNKKYYFSGGVVAAFECKLTLRPLDIKKAFATASLIKTKVESTRVSIYDSLFSPPYFGLLAHSNIWRRGPTWSIYHHIEKTMISAGTHPRELPDILCVADAGTYVLGKRVLYGSRLEQRDLDDLSESGKRDGAVSSIYIVQPNRSADEPGSGLIEDSLASLIRCITWQMAQDDETIRPWAEHLSELGFYGGIGRPLYCDGSILPDSVLSRIRSVGFDDAKWSLWSQHIP